MTPAVVYVLTEGVPVEGMGLVGVFTTLDAAHRRAVKRLEAYSHVSDYELQISAMVLNGLSADSLHTWELKHPWTKWS